MIHLTDGAKNEIKRLLEKEGKPELGLRMGVEGGGCSGFSYSLGFDSAKEGDKTFEVDGIKVMVDSKSLLYLAGTQLDYIDTLQEKGFKFENPNAKKSCGCGSSFGV